MNQTITANENIITLSTDNLTAVKKSMKIGFYRSFYNKGIITAAQLEKLMQIVNQK